MLHHTFKQIVRSLWLHKSFTLINLLGLSIGMGAVTLIFLIASPIAWYFMSSWLQDFAYRINIGWEVFALAGMFALLLAFITISYQAVKAASANPVNSLRTE
jgi:putative ABC transport system permease protein